MSQVQKVCMIVLALCWFMNMFGTVDTYNEECLYGFYCEGMYDPLLKSQCDGEGTCKCDGDFVQTNCLPNVSNCFIQHGPTTQGHPTSVCTQISSSNICSRDFETYHCDGRTNSNYEVHILGSYQALSCCNDVPETSRIEVVNNEGHGKRELVLVLASTRPIAWYLDMEDGMEIQRVVLVHKTPSLSSVLWSRGDVKEILKVSNVTENQNNFYGKGRDTIELLQYVSKRYGPIASFTGRYQVQQWRLRVGLPSESGNSLVSTPSRYESMETSTIPHENDVSSSIVFSSYYEPASTPLLPSRSKISQHPFASSSHTPHLKSVLHHSKSPTVQTNPPVSTIDSTDSQVLPSPLVFFHAIGTLEFRLLSGLNYYANGTLKVRAPLSTQPFNSISKIEQSITPTSSISDKFSSTHIFRQSISPSASTAQISTTLVQTAFETSRSTIELGKANSSFATLSTANTVSSLVSTAVSSPAPNMVSSAAVMTTPSLPFSCNLNNPCHQYATCTDIPQGVSCACKDGFNGNGFHCDDIDECIFQPCPTNNECQNTPGSYNCTCLQPRACRETRIVGPAQYSGRVEVLHNGEWGTICAIGWDREDVQVACRDAGFPYYAGLSYNIGYGRIWLSNVECNGHETRLSDCPNLGWGNVNIRCTHELDVGIECEPTTLRLAGSDKPDEGRVEIYFDGEWGTICDNGWDIDDANIACAEMGFPGAERALMGSEVQDGQGRVWLNNVECTGVLEQFLKDCRHTGWGNASCGHNRDAGVKCLPKVSCDFEINTCSWQNEKQGDNFDWRRHRTSTPTLLTGPSFDNTKKSMYGVYMYIETTGRKPGDKAWLVSPTIQPKVNECLRFHYHMSGTDIGQLNVNLRESGATNITRLWNLAGSRKSKWVEASVPLNFTKPSEIIFEAISGVDHKSDIAIDDITIELSPCTVYPVGATPDVDECLTKPCDANATCTNTIGSYHCKCNKGYAGNGTLCSDINECVTNPCHVNATCTNTVGGFLCTCNPNTEGICDDAYRPCGLREIFTQLGSRIIGGNAAEKGSWPWTAAIFYSGKKEHVWCAGALINNEWILTAAHCFDNSLNKEHYRIILGEHDILNEEPEQQNFTVKQIILHPAYQSTGKSFDIALVRLKTPANYTANILPICLLKKELPAGTNCFTAGWGTRTSSVDDYPQFLREALVPLISKPTCETLYSRIATIDVTMVCAGYTTGTVDTCQGDSGGPLMCQQGHKWYLAGLTSFGLDCATKGYPGIYANIADLYEWVEIELSFY